MSISAMPSAPKADEIAARLPNVSRAHASTCCGLQLSAVECNSAILFFTSMFLPFALFTSIVFMPSPPHLLPSCQREKERFRTTLRKTICLVERIQPARIPRLSQQDRLPAPPPRHQHA